MPSRINRALHSLERSTTAIVWPHLAPWCWLPPRSGAEPAAPALQGCSPGHARFQDLREERPHERVRVGLVESVGLWKEKYSHRAVNTRLGYHASPSQCGCPFPR